MKAPLKWETRYVFFVVQCFLNIPAAPLDPYRTHAQGTANHSGKQSSWRVRKCGGVAGDAQRGNGTSTCALIVPRLVFLRWNRNRTKGVSIISTVTPIDNSQLQRLAAAAATTTRTYSIPNATPGCAIMLTISLSNGRPFVLIQDSKHGAKTARNQIFTGARILSLGDKPLFYSQMHDLAFTPLSPLYRRDVENVDRQDDRAAARLFSAATLKFHIDNWPHRQAAALYLFFLGGLVDAWQSRTLPHCTRILLCLRCRFFLMAWRAHVVAHPDHSPARNFISRESNDILRIMCESLIALVLSYRDYWSLYPLLPWLHSTEPAEHVFGMLRQLKSDFTYGDFLSFAPKLMAYLKSTSGPLSRDSKANLTASGYWHTYSQVKGLDLAALVAWPSDQDIAKLSERASVDVSRLLRLVGIAAEPMLRTYAPKSKATPVPARPPRPPRNCASLMRLPNTLINELLESDSVDNWKTLMAQQKDLPLSSHGLEAKIDATAAAIAATTLQESITM